VQIYLEAGGVLLCFRYFMKGKAGWLPAKY
jgi:hypothetical protein